MPGGVSVPLTLESWQLIDGRLGGWISYAAQRCVAALLDGRPAPPAVLELSTVHEDPTFVLAPGHDSAQLEGFAALAGTLPVKPRRGSGHEHEHLPAIRADPFCVPELDAFLAEHGTWVAPEALEALQEIREEHARAAGLVALSAATDAPLEVAGLGGELKPFQRAGVSYLLAQRRAFLADEQGLGKTIEALATLEADGAYPAIVVCPASLKLNWLRELERWLPDRSAHALVGTGGEPTPAAGPADVTVVNYDIVAARLEELRALAPRALVLDESHYCKNAARQAHPGGPAALRGGAARGSRAGADRHAGDEPPAGADRAAADPRAARRTSARARSSAGASAAPTPTCACTGTCARAASCGA